MAKSTERIFKVINTLVNTGNSTYSEIQKATDLPKSTLHDLLDDLLDSEFLVYNENDKRYGVGLNLFHLALQCVSRMDFLKTIDMSCSQLSDEIDETVHAAILNGTHITYISKHEGTKRISIIDRTGMSLGAHATAIGKALLSQYTTEQIREIYSNFPMVSYTPNTKSTVDDLLVDVLNARRDGYATEYGEISLLAACVGVPVVQNGQVVAAISVTVPIGKLEVAYRDYLLTHLKKTKERIESIINVNL